MTGDNFVYVIRFGELDHKIGYSNEPQRRRHQLPGAQHVVRVWRRPADAPKVEGVAHRLLARWLLEDGYERFGVPEAAACHAVEAAIAIVDAMPSVDRQNGQPKFAGSAVVLPMREPLRAPEMPGLRIGYAMQHNSHAVDEARRLLVSAGVEHGRVYADIGEPGPGLLAARKAIRQGDVLVVATPHGADPETCAAVTARGGAIQEIAA